MSSEDDVYEVEDIISKRYYDGQLQYWVKWDGYDDESENTWQSQETLEGCDTILNEFELRWTRRFGQSCLDSDSRVPTYEEADGKRWKFDPGDAPPTKRAPRSQSGSTARSASKSKRPSRATAAVEDDDLMGFIASDSEDPDAKRRASNSSRLASNKSDRQRTNSKQRDSASRSSSVSKEKSQSRDPSGPTTTAAAAIPAAKPVNYSSFLRCDPPNGRVIKKLHGVTTRLRQQQKKKNKGKSGGSNVHYLVEWEKDETGEPAFSMVTTDWASKHCPLMALRYFEKHIEFKNLS